MQKYVGAPERRGRPGGGDALPGRETANQNDMAQTQSKTEAAALRKFLNKREDIAVQILAGIARADGMQRNPAEAAA